MRIFALSDIHVDTSQNLEWLRGLSRHDFQDDVLLVAGDVSHLPERLGLALGILKERFGHVFYTPGNHDFWLRGTPFEDSISKLEHILEVCEGVGAEVRPRRVSDDPPVSIFPLLTWYTEPEDGDDSLFLPKKGEDPSLQVWGDHHFVRWPGFSGGQTANDHLLGRNPAFRAAEGELLITLSHFLPRQELMFAAPGEIRGAGKPRDPFPSFNFSRVAGSTKIDRRLREAGATVHIYGHQHRNRARLIDGVLYVSHCLGYPKERLVGMIRDIEAGPRLIWSRDVGLVAKADPND